MRRVRIHERVEIEIDADHGTRVLIAFKACPIRRPDRERGWPSSFRRSSRASEFIITSTQYRMGTLCMMGDGLSRATFSRRSTLSMIGGCDCRGPAVFTEPGQGPHRCEGGSITYEDVAYPYPVDYLPLNLYGQDVQLAYMDVAPAGTPTAAQ